MREAEQCLVDWINMKLDASRRALEFRSDGLHIWVQLCNSVGRDIMQEAVKQTHCNTIRTRTNWLLYGMDKRGPPFRLSYVDIVSDANRDVIVDKRSSLPRFNEGHGAKHGAHGQCRCYLSGRTQGDLAAIARSALL